MSLPAPITPLHGNQKVPAFLKRKHLEPSVDTENGEESTRSEDLEVIDTEENVKYQENLTVGVLSRLGFRKTLWRSKFGSYFVVMSYAMSYEIITTMSFKLEEYGVGFIVMYMLCMILMGFPLMYLEMALGQYCSANALFVFTRMAPAFGGVAILALFHNLVYLVLDQRTITFFAKFFFDSVNIFSSDHAWQKCNGGFNNKYCFHSVMSCYNAFKEADPSEQSAYSLYFTSHGASLGESCVPLKGLSNAMKFTRSSVMDTLSRLSHFDFIMYNFDIDTGAQHDYVTHLSIFYLILILIVIAITVKHSSKVLVKMAACVQMLAYALVITLIYILVFRYPPEFPFMFAFQGDQGPATGESTVIWYWRMFVAAFLLALNATKVGQGGLFFLGSQNHFHNNFIWDSFGLCLLMTFVPLVFSALHGLIIDSYFFGLNKGNVQNFATMTSKAVTSSKLYTSGNELVLLSLLSTSLSVYKEFETVIVCVFSLIWMLNAICNKAIRCEILVSTILEIFPATNTDENRSLVINSVVYGSGLFVMIFFSTFGFDINNDWQQYLIPMSIIVCVILQLVVIGFCYGPPRLFANVTFMLNGSSDTGQSIVTLLLNTVLMILWFIVIPICSLFVLTYKMLSFPIFVNHWYMNVLFLLFTWLIVPLYLLNQIVKQKSGNSSISRLFKPQSDLWGPRNTSNRKKAENLEKQIRGF